MTISGANYIEMRQFLSYDKATEKIINGAKFDLDEGPAVYMGIMKENYGFFFIQNRSL